MPITAVVIPTLSCYSPCSIFNIPSKYFMLKYDYLIGWEEGKGKVYDVFKVPILYANNVINMKRALRNWLVITKWSTSLCQDLAAHQLHSLHSWPNCFGITLQINSNIFDGVIKAQSDDTPGTTVEDITDSLDCVMAALNNDNDSDGASLYAEPHVEIKTHHKSPAVLTVSLPSKPPAPQTFTALAIHDDPSAPSVSTWSLPTAMTSHAAASVEGIPKDLSADTGTSNTKVQKKAARGKRTKAPVNDTDVCHSSSNTTAK
ncbi:hypothetical protein BDR05DRAFT_1012993 [Suillus weaverae]|nr:hypothetical protein BDR05DRAFT_1012993 [Suillus weaverae]